MRVGIFTETYTPYISGLVTSEIMLKKALEKLGHEVYVVTANLESFHYDYDEKERVLKIPGIPTGIYDSRLTAIYPIRAVNIIKGWNLDIIHSQTEFAIGTFARIFAKQFDIPLVHTYHTIYEDYVHYITHGYFNKSSKKLAEYFSLFYCDKTATELIVPSEKIYRLFKDKYKVERNIHIVPTCIETERFWKENIDSKKLAQLKKKYNLTKKDFVYLFVGRLAEEKNVEFLLEVTKDLVKKYSNFKFMIIGDGPDMEKYQKYSKENHLENNIIFTGKVPWDEIPVYYQLCQVFVTASVTETQGLTVVEALAASIPVVCVDDASFHNVVIPDLNGQLFKTKKQCKEYLIDLYEHPAKRKHMALQARISSDRYGLKYYGEAILDVYRNAIKTKKESKGFFEKMWDRFKGEEK